MNEGLKETISQFEDWALFDGKYSISTIKRDSRKLREISKTLDLMKPDVNSFREYFLEKVKSGYNKRTLNVTRKAVKKWIRFLKESKGTSIDFEIPKFKESKATHFWIPGDEEVRKIIDAADNQKNREVAARDGAIMRILFSGGLRIGEVAMLNLEDIKENGIFVHSEKGEADCIVGVSTDCISAVRKYISQYRRDTNPKALFTSASGRIKYEYLRQHISEVGKRAVKEFHPHSARHWVATALLFGRPEMEMPPLDIRFVQTHLRHTSLASTQIYTHVDPAINAEQVKERLNKFFQEIEYIRVQTRPNKIKRVRREAPYFVRL